MREIEMLIPHREPFLYVDEILSATQEEIVGVKTFASSDAIIRGNFPDYNFVPGAILIESMAQCGGAGVRKLGLIKGLLGLANIESANFYKGVEFNKRVKMVVKNIKLSDRIIKQSGIVYMDDIPCADATWMCVRL